MTYAKQSKSGRLSGLNSANQSANPNDEKAFQIQQKLIKIARDVEYSFLNGTYNKTTDGDTANKTRGMLELCTSDAGTSIDAKGAALSKNMFDQLFREMADNGAMFGNMVLFCNSYIKQAITNLYADFFKAQMQMTQNIAGMNIIQIESDFCKVGICFDPFIKKDSLLVADVAQIAPVFQPVPGKGNFFEEQLAKNGASDRIQIYGQVGLAHAPAFLHGAIKGLEVK